MSRRSFKYIYGPVYSFRLGNSLGIDLLSQGDKICSFDCIYCQQGKTRERTTKRKLYVPAEEVLAELELLPEAEFDYITFSGRGEPSLALNLGRLIKAIKRVRPEPVAVITNSSLLADEGVRNELISADFVIAKLDAPSQELFRVMNRPAPGISFAGVLQGIKEFKKKYRGK